MLETKNILKKASLSLIVAALFALNGCSSDYFDSSIGPDGKKIQFDNNLKPTKSAPQKKQPSKQALKVEAKQSDTAKAPSVTDTEGVVNAALAAAGEGQVKPPMALNDKQPKPYVPDEQDIAQVNSAAAEVVSSVEVINESLENSVNSLSVQESKCQALSKAEEVAYKIAVSQAPRLKNETGPVYIARTVVPDEYTGCVSDISPVIDRAFSQNGILTVEGAGVNVSAQNTGSATLIPSLIKACKQSGIPLLNVSVVRSIGVKTVITIRNIRVKDGITLAQNTTQL